MLRISEDFDFEREFARKERLLDFDIPEPVEIISPSSIYLSPRGTVYKDFLPKEPPVISPRFVSTRPEYVTTAPPATRRITGPKFKEFIEQTSTPGKNFVDIFFDWLNKILSGR